MKIQSTEYPILGFNAYDCWGADINEERALANIEAFAKKLYPHGYEYFCFDAAWYTDLYYRERIDDKDHNRKKNMDEYGRLNPSKRKFPNGLKPLTDRCHELGFKFGLHFMRGIPKLAVERNCPIYGTNFHAADIADPDNDCVWGPENVGVDMTKPGAQEYYDSVIAYFAENGVDFVKVDDMAEHPAEIEAVGKAIAKAGRPMIYSLSPGDNVFRNNMPLIRKYANMLRITGDVWDRAWDLQKAFDRWEQWEKYGSNECWLDLDMIPFGMLQVYIPEGLPLDHVPHDLNEKRASRLTLFEKRTFMAQRALAASPLLFGGELTMTPDEDIALVTNEAMLECNRNGIVGERIYGERNIDIRRVFKRSSKEHGWIGIFNRKGDVAYKFSIPLEALGGIGADTAAKMTDIWTGKKLDLRGNRIFFNMRPWECFFAKF